MERTLHWYKLTARISPKHQGVSVHKFKATSRIEAENKLKASFPDAIIISCLRGEEVIQKRPTLSSVIMEKVGGAILATLVGFVLYKKFSDKDQGK